MEFKIPKRFCETHGVAMVPDGIKKYYDSQTGALETLYQHYKCPKWFCGDSAAVQIVGAGKVLIP